MRAPKEVIHELQFFVELLHNGVCGAEFVEQCQTPHYLHDMVCMLWPSLRRFDADIWPTDHVHVLLCSYILRTISLQSSRLLPSVGTKIRYWPWKCMHSFIAFDMDHGLMPVTHQDIWLLLTDCHRSHGILPIRQEEALADKWNSFYFGHVHEVHWSRTHRTSHACMHACTVHDLIHRADHHYTEKAE